MFKWVSFYILGIITLNFFLHWTCICISYSWFLIILAIHKKYIFAKICTYSVLLLLLNRREFCFKTSGMPGKLRGFYFEVPVWTLVFAWACFLIKVFGKFSLSKFVNNFTLLHVFKRVLSLQFAQIYDPHFKFNKRCKFALTWY